MKGFLRSSLGIFERSVVRLNHWEHIPGSSWNMIYIVPQTYRGNKLTLDDGTTVCDGDVIAEIHIDNLKVGDIKDDLKTIFSIWDDELKNLTKVIKENGSFAKIKAYYGRTVLYPLIRKRGFTIFEMQKGVKTDFIRIWDNILRIVFKAEDIRDRNAFKTPRECWISRETILKRYAPEKGKIDEKSI